MCGICGFVGAGDREILKEMTDTLSHRGPDDEGFYFNPPVGLGHRRLSVIDLATGRQPISNEDETIQIIFNGEIYNFKELESELVQKGHRFKTKTDTEVVVHLYEEKGEKFLDELNGMFSLALWDAQAKKLILARDRLGEKPLYYSFSKGNLIFGSELKAILKHPGFEKRLNKGALAKYLAYEYVPAPETIFDGARKLGAGEYLVYQNGGVEIKKYWEIKFGQKEELSEKQYLLKLDEELERAVKMRLVADVPLGIFLSGGIDSSAIAYYAQKNSRNKIKTFSIGFEDKSFDESAYARKAAKHLGTEHYEKILTPRECLDLIPQIANFLDEPLGDASIIPTYLLSKFTREKVAVALGGDGGDELLMGYPTFQAHKLDQLLKWIPAEIKERIIRPVIGLLPASVNNISFDFKLKRFFSGAKYISEIKNQIWLGSFTPEEIKKIFLPSFYQEINQKNIFSGLEDYLKNVSNELLGNRLIYLYLKNYLQDNNLVKVDRASMAVGLEVRAPFLDYHLVDFCNSVPNKYKLNGWRTKYLLKELMKDKLPPEIVCRPKKGFGIPVAKWLRNELKEFALDMLSKEKIKREGIFNPDYIEKLLQEHFNGRKDNRKPLWTLLVFQIWKEKWR